MTIRAIALDAMGGDGSPQIRIQGALDAVEYSAQETGAQLYGEGPAEPLGRLAGTDAGDQDAVGQSEQRAAPRLVQPEGQAPAATPPRRATEGAVWIP